MRIEHILPEILVSGLTGNFGALLFIDILILWFTYWIQVENSFKTG